MTWDDLGRLTAVKDAAGTVTLATYTYDPLDRLRMIDYGAGVRTRFRYVGLTTSAAQLIDDAAGTVTRHIGTGWSGERLLDWTGSGSDIRIHGTNNHHDVTWLAGSTGSVSQALRYDPWGNPRSSVPSGYTPFRFQGSFYDTTTDLSWVVTRWYAPALGTFISEDSLLGDPADPPSRHLYAYGTGDPVGRWDPDGRVALETDDVKKETHFKLVKTVRLNVTENQMGALKWTFAGTCAMTGVATLVLANLVSFLCATADLGIDHMVETIQVRHVEVMRMWKSSYYRKAIRLDSRPALDIRVGAQRILRVAPRARATMELRYLEWGNGSSAIGARLTRSWANCSKPLNGNNVIAKVRAKHLHWNTLSTCGAYSGQITTNSDPWNGGRSTIVKSRVWPGYWRSGLSMPSSFWFAKD